MTLKLSQVAILLTLITVTVQLSLVGKKGSKRMHHGIDFDKILDHLEKHTNPHHEEHAKTKQGIPANLINIQNLNLYLYRDDKKLYQRSDVQERLCQRGIGRCGCSGKRCDDDREEKREEEERRESQDQIEQILDALESELSTDKQLRCSKDRCEKELRNGERCGCRPRREKRDDEDDEDEDTKVLRCKNNRCGGERSSRSEQDLRLELERYGKKYKINDELDAIVLDLTNFSGLLGKLNNRDGKKQRKLSINPDLDLDYYFSFTDEDKNDKSDLLDAYMIDLDEKDPRANSLLISAKNRAPLNPNDLRELLEVKLLNMALNYIKNKKGDLDLSYLTREQKRQLQKLRSQVQKVGMRSDDVVLKEKVRRIFLNSKERNKFNLPKWLQRAVNIYNYDYSDLRTKKRLLPLTSKQKLKLSAKQTKPPPRNIINKSVEQYGVPFELQVEGLGQANLQ